MSGFTKHVLVDDMIGRMADSVMELKKGENTILPALRKQLKDTQRGIDNLVDAIQQGIITSSTKQRLDELEATKEKLKISIVQEEMQKPLLTREQVVFWISQFKNGNMKDEKFRQRLIDTFVNAIYLYDDKIVLTYNYKDGTGTISLDQVEKSLDEAENTGSDLKACAPPNKRVGGS